MTPTPSNLNNIDNKNDINSIASDVDIIAEIDTDNNKSLDDTELNKYIENNNIMWYIEPAIDANIYNTNQKIINEKTKDLIKNYISDGITNGNTLKNLVYLDMSLSNKIISVINSMDPNPINDNDVKSIITRKDNILWKPRRNVNIWGHKYSFLFNSLPKNSEITTIEKANDLINNTLILADWIPLPTEIFSDKEINNYSDTIWLDKYKIMQRMFDLWIKYKNDESLYSIDSDWVITWTWLLSNIEWYKYRLKFELELTKKIINSFEKNLNRKLTTEEKEEIFNNGSNNFTVDWHTIHPVDNSSKWNTNTSIIDESSYKDVLNNVVLYYDNKEQQ